MSHLSNATTEMKSQAISSFTLDEMGDRLRRKKSLIISGIPEFVDGTTKERNEVNGNKMKTLLKDLYKINDNSVLQIHRIGRK